ncbi:hypothetical protein [Muribacter muris]|uniref:hypothetical protein n=1 Tax=Muribacter muris TaxID=67855 RepID=UPI000B22D3EF|nr:hypothetical protein [Muribacter muris]
MNENAPYIREIVDKTAQIGGTRVVGKTPQETKQNVLHILNQQLKQTQTKQNVRT